MAICGLKIYLGVFNEDVFAIMPTLCSVIKTRIQNLVAVIYTECGHIMIPLFSNFIPSMDK